MNLKNKTLFITGASRGIGKAIAIRAAKDGANIIIAAKTTEPKPNLPGTIYTAAEEIRKAGGNALPQKVDIRFEDQVQNAIDNGIEEFGAIDILVNNASAISLTPTEQTEMKKFDLMISVNVRGTFLCSKLCIPYLKNSDNPHILTMSPPLNMDGKWFKNNLAYTISKYGMSMCVLGLSEELEKSDIAVNALWPKTSIATAAVRNLLGGEKAIQHSRKPEIVADAAYLIFTLPSRDFTGNFLIDEEILKKHGVTNFKKYAIDPEKSLISDFFLEDVD